MKKRGKIFSKRGLSEVITSVIMILLVLVAIGIVWVVVKNVLTSGTEQSTIDKINIRLRIEKVVLGENQINITLKRSVGSGEFSRIKFVFTDGINSEIIVLDETLKQLEEKMFTLTLRELEVSNVTDISVVPVLTTPSGKKLDGLKNNYVVRVVPPIIDEWREDEEDDGLPLSTTSTFLSGFKIQNTDDIRELSEVTFKLANELGIDYVLVPIKYPFLKPEIEDINWSEGLDYYYIFNLSEEYNISIHPSFFKLGGADDKDAEKYSNFVMAFLEKFYNGKNIDYIEFQNEPVKDYNGETSQRFKGTPIDLANSNNKAYEKVKEEYPNIKIGTAGFMASAVNIEENEILNSYYKEYLLAKPKFDVLTLHFYPKTSSFLQTTDNSGEEYNFLSENKIFDTYRILLDDYGYNNTEIFPTEGVEDIAFKDQPLEWMSDEEVDILLMERFILTINESNENNIPGLMISGIESSYNSALFYYETSNGDYTKTNKFYFYGMLLNYLDKYPNYSKHIVGEINSEDYWVEEFKNNNGKKMWMAFCPFLFRGNVTDNNPQAIAVEKSINCPQEVSLDVGNINSVNITDISNSYTSNVENMKVNFTLNKEPVFIEEN